MVTTLINVFILSNSQLSNGFQYDAFYLTLNSNLHSSINKKYEQNKGIYYTIIGYTIGYTITALYNNRIFKITTNKSKTPWSALKDMNQIHESNTHNQITYST